MSAFFGRKLVAAAGAAGFFATLHVGSEVVIAGVQAARPASLSSPAGRGRPSSLSSPAGRGRPSSLSSPAGRGRPAPRTSSADRVRSKGKPFAGVPGLPEKHFSAAVSFSEVQLHGEPRRVVFQKLTENKERPARFFPDLPGAGRRKNPENEDMRIGAFLKPGGDYFEYSTSNGNRLSGDTPIRYLDDWKNGEPEIVLRYAFTKTASSAVEAGSSSSSHETVASLTREQKARLTKEQQCAVLHGAKKYQSSEDLVLQDIRNGRVDIQNAEDYLRNQVPFDVRRNYRLMNSLVCLAPRVLQYATRDVLRTHAPAPVPKRERKQVRFKKIFKGWESDTDVEARIKNLPSQNSNVVVPGPQCDYSHHLRRYVRNEQPCDVVPRPGCAHSHVPHRSGRSAPGRSSPSRDAGSPGLQETSDFALGDRLKRINALNNFTYIGWERIGGEDDKRRWVARRESVNPNRCTFNLPKRECTRCCRRLRGASQEEQVRSVYRGLVSVSRALCCYLV